MRPIKFQAQVKKAEQFVYENTELGPDGYKLRELIAEGGFEVTPDELHHGLVEAKVRIGHGKCKFCENDNCELRYGMCFECFSN